MRSIRFSSLIPILYIVAWCISPPLIYGNIFRVLVLVALGILCLQSWKNSQIMQKKQLIFAILLCIYMVLMSIITGDAFNQRMGIYMLLIICTVTNLGSYMDTKNSNKIILWCFLLYIVWNITTIRQIFVDPDVMRELAKNTESSTSLARRGVGGYGYLYSVVLALPVGIIYLLNKEEKKINRLIATAFVISSLFLVAQSQYFMALLLTVLIIPLVFICRKTKVTSKYITTIILLLAFVIIFFNIEKILLFLIDKIEVQTVQRKLSSMYSILLKGGSVEDSEFATRGARYAKSFIATLRSPIWGGFTYSITGNHSNILDYTAQYGIPIGCLYLYILSYPLLMWKKRGYSIVSAVLIVAVLIAGMNTIPHSIAVPLYIMLPMFCKIQEKKKWLGSQ